MAAPTHDDSASLLPRVLGRYVLLRRIARGGMGEVFLACTTGVEGAERPVVVKIIRREHAKDPSFLARFLDEARVQAQLQHSGVAQVLEAALDPETGEPYTIVEYVEGRSLGDVRARATQIGHKLAWEDGVAITAMIAESLAHVHERLDAVGKALSIVHRDLSPQNVMLSYQGEVKIIDFGTARGQNRRCHTVSGVVFAKPGYVAPEVANGDSGDARVDIYALGVMLWELVANKRFLQGDANVHTAQVARGALPPPPIAKQVGAPAELDVIIAKLTATTRDERYLAARSAARDLAKLLTSATPLASGERGIRARATELMQLLFAGEPSRSRKEFARLVAEAKTAVATKLVETPKKDVSHEAVTTPEEKQLLPGTRYRLRREIGRGASSVVFEAEHIDLGRRVAVKLLSEEAGRSEEFASRLKREARALARLEHPGLVEIVDFGRASDGRLFCVMELLEGETLESMLARERTLSATDALGLADKALAALDAAHAAGLVHRDVKPANLFLPKGGGLKLLDFGLVKTPEEADGGERNSIYGTPEYMAPEQAQAGDVDARADLYAVGAVLYEALTGRLPFPQETAVAILEAKGKGSPERIAERAPTIEVPRAVDDLVMKALARHASERFASATEMRAAIKAALDAPVRLRARRRKVGFALVALTMAFAAIVFVGRGKHLKLPTWSRKSAVVAAAAEPVVAAPAVVAAAPVETQAPAVQEAPVAVAHEDAPVAVVAHEDAPVVAQDKHDETAKDEKPEPKASKKHEARAGKRAAKTELPAIVQPAPQEKASDATAKNQDAKAPKKDKKHKKKARLAKAT
jgi:serine/threonine-protein kinase